ncbi:transposase protein B [Rhodopseudomonas palustris TIE-1]|uniref:AAA family ATPase n=1 Tax=Rhodopseudomonas palustris TaxID=1076 RepID=UPI0001779777|nr:AAA family ATPase [Rhodopseudomonas palustris]ACF01869.1 transposase protein B [Rhodopseudomonas palustris TIE-1]
MSKDTTIHRGPIALSNVASFMVLTLRLVERAPNRPGFGVYSGFPGLGKSCSSIVAQNKTRAVRVEVGDSWTRRTLLTKIITEFGEKPPSKRASIADLAQQAIRLMGEDPRRPLFVDEADKLVDKGIIEILRELQETSTAPVILIGEENLPTKLAAFDRIYDRVLVWEQAQHCTASDVRELARAYWPKLKFSDELLETIRVKSAGRVRRILNNFDEAAHIASNRNLTSLGVEDWGTAEYHTGRPSKKVRDASKFDSQVAIPTRTA